MLQRPGEFLALGLATMTSFGREDSAHYAMARDLFLGGTVPEALTERLERAFGFDPADVGRLSTVSGSAVPQAFSASRYIEPWILVVAPLLALANLLLVQRRPRRDGFATVVPYSLAALGVTATTVFLMPMIAFRYLHPLIHLGFVEMGILLALLRGEGSGRRPGASGRP